jgi:flagellar biosynthesis anti-sigma factor FlgM
MKIDYTNLQFPDDLQSSQVGTRKAPATTSKTATASGVSSPTGEDTVQLSGAHNEIQALGVALARVPEVRSARVNGLQQQVRGGQYQPDSGKIADAIIAEQTRPKV